MLLVPPAVAAAMILWMVAMSVMRTGVSDIDVDIGAWTMSMPVTLSMKVNASGKTECCKKEGERGPKG